MSEKTHAHKSFSGAAGAIGAGPIAKKPKTEQRYRCSRNGHARFLKISVGVFGRSGRRTCDWKAAYIHCIPKQEDCNKIILFLAIDSCINHSDKSLTLISQSV
ncbi:hypothetical protein ANACOL_03946 [Anaerotruncus colihominis DSM 17241]|jgi:hypothetical protein|uniref:Uncharacterized protein n=1 Tax=Anaerotruncus colihominis DSM 17241 TaxID=445972 RepID=B0PGS8_9FIRM|nr:hypothetical protein ANACOL_03946 [Anaerotruncus colihominis DSM 17241]